MRELCVSKHEEIIYQFQLYYSGWECDDKAWIVKNSNTGKVYCVGTNHGCQYNMSIAELGDFISEYKKAISDTKKAIHLLQGIE